jgi:hypothetical protein
LLLLRKLQHSSWLSELSGRELLKKGRLTRRRLRLNSSRAVNSVLLGCDPKSKSGLYGFIEWRDGEAIEVEIAEKKPREYKVHDK